MLREIKKGRSNEQKKEQKRYFYQETAGERNGSTKKANMWCGVGKECMFNICFNFFQYIM